MLFLQELAKWEILLLQIMKNNFEKSKKSFDSYVKYSSIAIQMGVIIALGIIGGTYLDKWLSWKFPVCTVVLSLLSVAASIYVAIKDLLKKQK